MNNNTNNEIIDALLLRDEITVDLNAIKNEVENKTILITGAAGSIGAQITKQAALLNAHKIILVDIAETPLHNLELEISQKFPDIDAQYILADIRDQNSMQWVIEFHKPDIIFHAAAYKHVPMTEKNPCQAVLTNIGGTINLARLAISNNVSKFVMISTDKAVNPTNIMGATKRIAELCVQCFSTGCSTEFITTRFGNVLQSNGSVLPLFCDQISCGGPVTVTHPDITRYFMSINEACLLVFQATTMGYSGSILAFDMGSPCRVADLANRLIELHGLRPGVDIMIEYIGLRPGEKLYEEVFDSTEVVATSHNRINIAQCRDVDLSVVLPMVDDLLECARCMRVEQAVRLMKSLVPEFVSQNSEFARFDDKSPC